MSRHSSGETAPDSSYQGRHRKTGNPDAVQPGKGSHLDAVQQISERGRELLQEGQSES
jgi:hypothetical protein